MLLYVGAPKIKGNETYQSQISWLEHRCRKNPTNKFFTSINVIPWHQSLHFSGSIFCTILSLSDLCSIHREREMLGGISRVTFLPIEIVAPRRSVQKKASRPIRICADVFLSEPGNQTCRSNYPEGTTQVELRSCRLMLLRC